MKKIFKILFISITGIGMLLFVLYLLFIYEKPVDENELAEFMRNQPVIDVHVHISKGVTNENYGDGLTQQSSLDSARLNFFQEEMDKYNVVLALGGGPIKYAKMWGNADSRFWVGPDFPYSLKWEYDEPSSKEFLTYEELDELYSQFGFKSMGEAMYVHKGIHPQDQRLEPYWAIAAKYNIPVGIHSDSGPPSFIRHAAFDETFTGEYANPELLVPILEKYPDLKLYLMHFKGGYFEECIELMKTYDQIYCEMSAISLFAPKFMWEQRIKNLYEEGLGNRLMFATDYPGRTRENIEIIYSLDWLSEQQKRDILYNNAARFLELDTAEIDSHYSLIN